MNSTEVLSALRDRIGDERLDYKKDPVVACQLAILSAEYVRHFWESDRERFETLAVEQEVLTDVVNPETGKPSRTWKHASKFDGLAFDRFEGSRVLVEHKSTTDGLEPWSPYWRRLAIDSQVSKYLLSASQADDSEPVRSVLYDVVKKPNTNPKQIAAKDVRGIAESGKYFGFDIRPAELARFREAYEAEKGERGGFKGKMVETLELYGLRLTHLIRSEPSAWFHRLTIVRTDEELLEYARELWQLGKEIRDSERSGIAPRNTSNCGSFGRLCEFFPICTGEKSADSDAFERVGFRHEELNSDAIRSRGDGRDILTNSRLTMFQSCRQREKLRYRDGLRPVGGIDSAPLHWGSLWHDLLEIVWNSYRKENPNG